MMRQKIIRAIAIVVGLTIIFYAAGIIAGATFNPFPWSADLRGAVATGWVIMSMVGFIVGMVAPDKFES